MPLFQQVKLNLDKLSCKERGKNLEECMNPICVNYKFLLNFDLVKGKGP